MPANTTSSSTRHRHKRQFQPSITSYFSAQDHVGSAAAAGPGGESIQRMGSPALPANVQSNLLNVGMRVRKAVPGGYRNKADESAGFKNERLSHVGNGKGRGDREDVGAFAGASGDGGGIAAVDAKSVSGLMPYCGLHKTGGLERQEGDWQIASRPGLVPARFDGWGVDVDDDGDVPFLSSQESMASAGSTDSMPKRGVDGAEFTNKRGYDDYEDGEDDTDESGVGHGWSGGMAGVRHSTDLDFGEAAFLRPIGEDGMEIG